MPDLSGKKVLLTGGLGTLGRAQARKLSAEGADVIVLDRPGIEGGEQRAKELGPTVSFVGCDLNDLASAVKTVEQIAADAGIDILINNAA
ncbi:MAG: SDR family NAD(P)-dependent oxidoreductase, partial [Mesorhizobium sp.]